MNIPIFVKIFIDMRKVEFEPYVLGGEADVFTIKFSDEKLSELDKFLIVFKDDQTLSIKSDLKSIFKTIEQVVQKGAKESLFRYEGKMSDRVYAIPVFISEDNGKMKEGTLRLYCIRLSDRLLILGGGGKKITRTYQEDRVLKGFVEILQIIDSRLMELERLGVNLEDELCNLSIEI